MDVGLLSMVLCIIRILFALFFVKATVCSLYKGTDMMQVSNTFRIRVVGRYAVTLKLVFQKTSLERTFLL